MSETEIRQIQSAIISPQGLPTIRPAILIFPGGTWGEVGRVFVALVHCVFGYWPEIWKALFLDFASASAVVPDSARKYLGEFGRFLKIEESWEFQFPSNVGDAIADRIEEEGSALAWLRQIVSSEEIRAARGAEALQRPALGAAWTALCLRNGIGGKSQLADVLTAALTSVEPGSEAVHLMKKRADASVRDDRVVTVVGLSKGGGTATGVALPVAIAIKHLARQLGIQLDVHLNAVANYRPVSEQEKRIRQRVARLADLRIAAAQDSSAKLSVPVSNTESMTASGPLFNRVFLDELGGRFSSKPGDAALALAFNLIWRLSSTWYEGQIDSQNRNELHRKFGRSPW